MSHADKVIEAIKAMTPEERVQSLISAGIIREDGTLMPQYGGTSTSGDIPTPETDAEQRQFGIGENRMYISADFARSLERRLAAATAELDRLRKEREERGNRILTRCPACKNDTLVINCGHLLCVWHECPDPCLIDQLSRLTAEVERLRECLQSMLDAYEELHAKYDLGDCEATIAARAAMSNQEKQQ